MTYHKAVSDILDTIRDLHLKLGALRDSAPESEKHLFSDSRTFTNAMLTSWMDYAYECADRLHDIGESKVFAKNKDENE